MVHKHYYQPSQAQKQELADATKQMRDAIARKRTESKAHQQVSAMLRTIIDHRPMDNPIINTDFGDLSNVTGRA